MTTPKQHSGVHICRLHGGMAITYQGSSGCQACAEIVRWQEKVEAAEAGQEARCAECRKRGRREAI